MEDPALPDPFAEERKEYARTIEDLFNKLAESEQYSKVAMEEMFTKLAESEQDRATAMGRMLDAEERQLDAEARRRLAEEDLCAQIEKAQRFEGLYYAEWEKRKAIEDELARSKEDLEEAKKR